MAVTYISQVSGVVGVPVPVTVYDANGNALAPANVTWSGLPADAVQAATATGFTFTFGSPHTGDVQTAASNGEMGNLTFVIATPTLKFSSP